MKLRRIKKSKTGRIEIIPMIDVMFFLLASFVLTSLSMQNLSGISVNLTKGEASQISLEKNITININKDGLVFLNQNPILLQNLASSIKPMIIDSEKIIIIAADQDSKQGIVTQAMLEAKKGGAQHFSIVVKK